MTQEMRERIKWYILEQVSKRKRIDVPSIAKTFDISRQTVYRYISALEADGLLKREDGDSYEIESKQVLFEYSTNDLLEEDVVFRHDIAPLIQDLPKNVFRIWEHAFMEMMNNAIEHAGAKTINVLFSRNVINTQIVVQDNGVGIFEKIRAYYKELGRDVTDEDIMALLLAGKMTTAKGYHSGEGIFFTSRAVDHFVIFSKGKAFSHLPHAEDVVVDMKIEMEDGTIVVMCVSNNTTKELSKVFDAFSDQDKGFWKTEIRIDNMFTHGYPVSRSEARRLYSAFYKFEEVVLDFENVESIGQAFAHELFIVFPKIYPKIKVATKNVADGVEKMIRRVKVTDEKNK